LKYLDTNPEKFQLVGLAEPVKEKREYLRDLYNVPANMCYESYEELLNMPKCADIVMICTQDKMHYEPAMMAIDKKLEMFI
jgi:predicted dehydrogenase